MRNHRKPAALNSARVSASGFSLRSGRAISEALTQAGVKTTAIDWDGTVAGANLPAGINRVFIALHGRGGEDGKFQALLDLEGEEQGAGGRSQRH